MTLPISCTPVTLPVEYRGILLRTTAHEIRKQYAGSALGAIWILLGPFTLLVLYSVIYLVVFRIQPVGLTLSQYVLYVMSGLLSFIAFAGGLVAGSNCLRADRELLLNRVFPSELLPLRATLVSSTPLIVGIMLVGGAAAFILGPTWWLLLLPVAVAGQLMFTAGIASLLALMTIISRDTQHVLQYLVLMLLIVTPIAYTPDMVPASIAPMLYANPLYYFVSLYQHAIVYQTAPSAHVLIGALALGVGMYALGFVAFQRGSGSSMTSHEARTNAARRAANRSAAAVQCQDISKLYKQYQNPRDMLFDQLGLRRLQFWKRSQAPRQFAALSNLNLVVRQGERLGVIGRNGAGKTTLLKVITGATEPSSGELTLGGNVQALMQIGIGFHPDFTGIENIRASLLYSELTPSERREAEEEIIDFVELGDFLAQPVRTYSLGMKSRLQFACATAIKPDILVIDEILGAGDAYFSAKSAERMRKLTGSGCTLILVSHSMGQVLQFCERAVWLEGGRIQAEGETRDVVKRYEKFTYELRKRTRLTDVDSFEFSRASNWQQIKVREALTASTPTGDHDPSSRWDVENSPIEITRASLLDQTGAEADLFRVGEHFIVRIGIRAVRAGRFPCRFSIVIYSGDGRVIGRPCSDWYRFELAEGESRTIQMVHDPLLLGSGRYFFSCAAYERLDLRNPADAKWYDLLARAIDFEVAEDEVDTVSAFHHPAEWSLVGSLGDPRLRS